MLPEFKDGTIVIVDSTQPVKDGDYVVARIDEGIELRKLTIRNSQWYLYITNPASSEYLPVEPASIVGKIIKCTDPNRRIYSKHFD